MLVDSIEIKVKKNDAMKHLFRKTPLISKIDQFNRKVEDVHLEFVEFKVLIYEVISRKKNKGNFRSDDMKHTIIMLVNTYNGHSQSVNYVPLTSKRYIARSCIKKSNVKDEYIIEKVKNEIINYINKSNKFRKPEKSIIKSIKILDVRSIYKPYWIGDYNGKNIFYPA